MAFKWSGVAGGAGRGALAGASYGPLGIAAGGILGGITGGFSRDIDKGITGNSGSGTTTNLMNLAAMAGAGRAVSKGFSGGNSGSGFLNSLFSKGGSSSGSNPLGGMSSYGGGNPPPTPPPSYGQGTSPNNPFGGQLTQSQLSSQTALQGANRGLGTTSWASKAQNNPLYTGLGTMAASQLIKSPQVPELPQSVIDFQNAAKAGNPLQNQAASALSQQLGMTQQDLGADEIAALNRQYDLAQEQELKQIDSMYKSLRPGTDPLTDSSYQQDIAKVRDRYATLRADSQAGAQRQISNDFAAQRVQQIAQANGISSQQMQQLATLSQYDLDRQLSQLNIDYQDKSTLRNYLLQLGGNIAASGYQQPSLFGSNPLQAGVK